MGFFTIYPASGHGDNDVPTSWHFRWVEVVRRSFCSFEGSGFDLSGVKNFIFSGPYQNRPSRAMAECSA